MALIQQEIKELRELVLDVREGKVGDDRAMTVLAVYSQIHKRTEQLLKIEQMNLKAGRDKTWRRMDALNLVGTGEAIEVEGRVALKCYARGGRLMDQEDCLDFSGSNVEACQDCPHFEATRRALLPAP